MEGYGRLDALNRIGNQVFSIDLKKPENYGGSSAPVHYPRIWNTPWFDWVQYNGSIMQPMVRNAGESLGVSSELNLTDPSKGLFKSSVDVDTLHEMEQMIAGKPPNAKDGFSGLKSPKWPEDILPKIDRKLAEKGGELYKEHCQECHRPPVSNKAAFFNFEDKKSWRTNQVGEPVLIIENIPIAHVGTDSAQAADMLNRTVALPANLGIDKNGFADALEDRGRKDRQLHLRPEGPALEQEAAGRPSTATCPTSSRASLPTRSARSTASGRRRPISTTARCRPSTTCSPRSRKGRSNSISATANTIP